MIAHVCTFHLNIHLRYIHVCWYIYMIYMYILPDNSQVWEDCTLANSFLSDSFRGLDALAAELQNFTQELEKKTFLPVSSEAWWSCWKGWWRCWSCDFCFKQNELIGCNLYILFCHQCELYTWTNAELHVNCFLVFFWGNQSVWFFGACSLYIYLNIYIYNTQVCLKFILGCSWTQKKTCEKWSF